MNWLTLEYAFTYLVFIVGVFILTFLIILCLLKLVEWIYLKYFFQRFKRRKKIIFKVKGF